jgi:hypothetical protein
MPRKNPLPDPKHPSKITPKMREIYLEQLAQNPVKNRAARIAYGMPPDAPSYVKNTFNGLEKIDPEFAEQVAAAVRQGYERVEQRALDLALNGSVELVYNRNGEVVGRKEHCYERTILFLLERGLPDRYKAKSELYVEGHVSSDTAGLTISPQDLLLLDTHERKQLINLLESLAAKKAKPVEGTDGPALLPSARA